MNCPIEPPMRLVHAFNRVLMTRRLRPIGNQSYTPVFDRIVIDVIHLCVNERVAAMEQSAIEGRCLPRISMHSIPKDL